MSQIPKKGGRPRLRPQGEKAKADVVNGRLRRQAQAAAARHNNNIRFQVYTAGAAYDEGLRTGLSSVNFSIRQPKLRCPPASNTKSVRRNLILCG